MLCQSLFTLDDGSMFLYLCDVDIVNALPFNISRKTFDWDIASNARASCVPVVFFSFLFSLSFSGYYSLS
jgi:hypothetical protein